MTDEQKPDAAGSGNHQVQLGIGTLIVIALIVTMCSGKSETEKVRKDTAELRKEVREINRKLDELAARSSPAATGNVEAPANAAGSPQPDQ